MDLNATFDSSFRRRSNPCESCRQKRRKCVPNPHDYDGPCYRCERMNQRCVYGPSKKKERPKELQKDEDAFEERAKMIGDVAELQRQLASFQKDVVALRSVPIFPALEEMVGLGTGFGGVEIDSTISEPTNDIELSLSSIEASVSTSAATFSDDASSDTPVSRPIKRPSPGNVPTTQLEDNNTIRRYPHPHGHPHLPGPLGLRAAQH
ncbi:hypothetical protein BC936DRAFT_141196 [Jimgerdemannia flammicorona]|uniref:Zn(2)-C6 fungal-type domain-containing protein n=1 Tax=Jimgerdemannia flammicorona TaxID=994334 RepID=A0A433DNX2_9FUNG|nr:hypothetical protein BC936DRAFT_141196 [Jimgerdemannia flammicorona]